MTRRRHTPLFLALALLAAGPRLGAQATEDPHQIADVQSIRRKLSYTIFKNYGRAREVADAILLYWGPGTRFSENAMGLWAVANRGGVMVNGRPYDAPGPEPIKVVMASDGNWIAASPEGFLHSGARFDDPETAARVYQDVLSFQTMSFGKAAPSRSPLRAGPSLAPQSAGFRVPAGLTVDRFAMEDPTPYFLEAPAPRRLDLTVEVDTEAPFVRRLLITRDPQDAVQRRSGFPPRFFVGATPVQFQVLMSETMAQAPRVEVEQADGTRIPAALLEDRNPLYTFQWFPFLDPASQGPATLEVLGDTQNSNPQFGTDLAGNPIVPQEDFSTFTDALVVDSQAPELVRIDTNQPGAFRTIPRENEVLAKHEFPKSVVAFVDDYDQPADPSGAGPTSTQNAAGVDLRRIGDGTGAIGMRLFGPDQREIRGTLSARINALELFLPDVYDPALGIFPDTDQDGIADPIEGSYRVQLDLVDEVGNTSSVTLPFGADVTPIAARSLEVSVRPILSDPFPNPPDPLPPGSPGDVTGGVFVRRLDGVEVRSPDPDFSFARSNVKIQSLAAGRFTVPVDLVGSLTRGADVLRFDIARDQNGDGQDDFENPAPGQFLPPGMIDPRFGKNDGLYRIVVEAQDKAGNTATIFRDLTLDTTPPEIGSSFPMENTTQFAPIRMVDVQLDDPKARSGSDGSGVQLTASRINLRFLGNGQTPAQDVQGLPFLHTPNPDDPTRPDFNPNDTTHRLLLEIVDEQGNVTKLPDDGSFDGIFQLDVIVRDQAGNEAMGTTTFLYSSEPPMEEPTAPMPMPQPLRLALVRP